MQICIMNILRAKTKSLLLFNVLVILLFLLPNSILSQQPKFKNLKSLNVGTKNDFLIKEMFTCATEEYFYASFKHVKIKKITIYRVEAKIRKSDSVCIEIKFITNNAIDANKLIAAAKREFGKPEHKVFKSPTTFDYVWEDKKYPSYLETKSIHFTDSEKTEFKIILLPQ